MRQRTCSHRISELYNEIILSGKFKEKYITQESFYLDDIYFTIFKDNGFKAKLLIIDKENQNIIFENLCDDSFIIFKNIKEELLKKCEEYKKQCDILWIFWGFLGDKLFNTMF